MPLSFRKNLKFQPKPETRLDDFLFDGGLVTDKHETKLTANQSPNLDNVIFNTTGSVKTRGGYTRYNTDAVGSASDTANTGAKSGTLNITAEGDFKAQTFIPSGSVSTNQINMYAAMNTSGQQQNVRVEIWSTTAGIPIAILTDNAQSQIKLISGTAETTYNFRFKYPIALTAATTYAIIVKPVTSDNSSTVNQVNVSHRGSTYANGQVYTSTDSGITWAGDSAKDLRFDILSGGNTGGTGLIRFYGSAGVQQLIAKFGSNLYTGNDSTGVMTQVTPGSGISFDTTNFLDWTVSNGTLLVVDGTNKIQKYRGSTNVNYSTGTISVTNNSATITGSSTAWNTSTNATVGEYIKLPDTKWYKITAIGSDTSLTIEINYQGSTLSAQTYNISPWGEIDGKLNSPTSPSGLVTPTPDFIENHINRIWTLDGNALRFSVLDTSVTEENINDWDTANNSGEIIIPTGKGDSGTGLYSLGHVLYVFQKHAIWGLYGNSPANFELRNITNEIGLIGKRTLVEWNDILIFLSDKGIQYFDGSNLKNVSDNVINKHIDTWANKSSPVATLWNNKYLLSYTPSGGTYNTENVFLDLTRQIYGKCTNVLMSSFSPWIGGTDSNEIYFTSSAQGVIYKWDSGTNDDGYEIETIYDTPSIGYDANVNDKTIKKVYLQQLAQGDYNMTITMLSDLATRSITSTIALTPGTASLWNVMQWDVDDWSAEGDVITTRIAEFQDIAKYYKFRFANVGYDEGIEILGLTTTARTRRLN